MSFTDEGMPLSSFGVPFGDLLTRSTGGKSMDYLLVRVAMSMAETSI